MAAATYRKKLATVQAARLVGSEADMAHIYHWIEQDVGSVEPYGDEPGITIDPEGGQIVMRLPAGVLKPKRGDWIVRDPKGAWSLVANDDFEATYDKV